MPDCFHLRSQKSVNGLTGKVNYKYNCVSGPGGENLSLNDVENICRGNFKRCNRYRRVR